MQLNLSGISDTFNIVKRGGATGAGRIDEGKTYVHWI